MKVASITGITGQDGSYLAELLLKKATKFTALSIAELAELISNVVSFQSKLKFDSSEPTALPGNSSSSVPCRRSTKKIQPGA